MRRMFIGNHTGPRQLEFPPNIAALRLGRLIRDPVLLPARLHDVRMLLVAPRHRADAVRAQELLFVQHA